jgi:hypothetical protein
MCIRDTACTVEIRNVYKTSVGRPDRKKPLRRPRYGWEDNTEMDLKKVRE